MELGTRELLGIDPDFARRIHKKQTQDKQVSLAQLGEHFNHLLSGSSKRHPKQAAGRSANED